LGGSTVRLEGHTGDRQGPDAPAECISLQILGRVQPHPKDPGTQVPHVTDRVAEPPAFQKRLLRRVLSVFKVAQIKVKGADQFGAHLVKGADEILAGTADAVRL